MLGCWNGIWKPFRNRASNRLCFSRRPNLLDPDTLLPVLGLRLPMRLLGQGARSTLADVFRRNHLTLFIAVITTAIYAVVFFLKDPTLASPDQFSFAQGARNIVTGQGYTTDIIYPISLHYDPSIHSHPNLLRPPLYATFIAIGYLVFGINGTIPILISGLSFAALVTLTYRFGTAMYSRQTGIWAGALVISSPFIVKFALAGLSDVLFAVLVTAVFYALYIRANPLLTGALVGAAYLTRYNVLLMLPFLAGFLYLDSRQDDPPLRFLGAFVGTISPWLLRNLLAVGDPLFSLQRFLLPANTNTYPPFSLLSARFTPVSPLEFVLSHPLDLLAKMTAHLSFAYDNLPDVLGGATVILLALIGVLRIRRKSRDLLFWGVVTVTVITQVLVLSAFRLEMRYLLPFVPLVFLLAGTGLSTLVEIIPGRTQQSLAIGFVIVLLVVPGFVGISNYSQPDRYASYTADAEVVEAHTEPNDIVVATRPWAVGWAGNRAAIRTPADYTKLHTRLSDADYLLLDSDIAYDHYNYSQQQVQTDYRLITTTPTGQHLYVRTNASTR